MARTNIVRAFLLCYNKNNKEVYNMYRNNYTNNYPYEMPYGYAPTYNAPQPVPQQAPSMNTNKIFVNGIDDVRSRIVPPNSDFMFLDNDKPLIYQKIVDAKGQFEVKVFDIVPHKDAPVSEPVYALRSDLDNVLIELTAIKSQLEKVGGKANESFEK